ncbi:MAG: recombination mediator RecR [Magnetococcus sp. WYHC-3]
MVGLPALGRTVELLARFPGIGRKSAWRMVNHLLKSGPDAIAQLEAGLMALRTEVGHCTCCGNLAQGPLCWICLDPARVGTQLCLVEDVADLLAMERSRVFRGRYHVLGGRLSPLDGQTPDTLNLAGLPGRLSTEGIEELVIATNPTVEGEATAHYVAQLVLPLGVRVTRPACGLPMGGELDYVDESTLHRAFEGRRPF